ncbi:hypothetical protein EK904_000114, partial [Melospiza melodia maxima]
MRNHYQTNEKQNPNVPASPYPIVQAPQSSANPHVVFAQENAFARTPCVFGAFKSYPAVFSAAEEGKPSESQAPSLTGRPALLSQPGRAGPAGRVRSGFTRRTSGTEKGSKNASEQGNEIFDGDKQKKKAKPLKKDRRKKKQKNKDLENKFCGRGKLNFRRQLLSSNMLITLIPPVQTKAAFQLEEALEQIKGTVFTPGQCLQNINKINFRTTDDTSCSSACRSDSFRKKHNSATFGCDETIQESSRTDMDSRQLLFQKNLKEMQQLLEKQHLNNLQERRTRLLWPLMFPLAAEQPEIYHA